MHKRDRDPWLGSGGLVDTIVDLRGGEGRRGARSGWIVFVWCCVVCYVLLCSLVDW